MSYNPVQYWNNRLKTVGTVNTTTSSGGLHPMEHGLIEKYIHPRSIILDYGIGGGRTIPLYQKLQVNCIGYDIADFSELINKKLDDLPEKYDKFLFTCVKEIIKLQYPDKYFDGVVSFSVLTHCRPDDIEFILSEMIRVGKILILSAYDDVKLTYNNDTYCFSHDYDNLFLKFNLRIIETQKVNKIRFWILKENQ
jgi:ubiquinone/menaquinone biosynthesis C-methylase UbiE